MSITARGHLQYDQCHSPYTLCLQNVLTLSGSEEKHFEGVEVGNEARCQSKSVAACSTTGCKHISLWEAKAFCFFAAKLPFPPDMLADAVL